MTTEDPYPSGSGDRVMTVAATRPSEAAGGSTTSAAARWIWVARASGAGAIVLGAVGMFAWFAHWRSYLEAGGSETPTMFNTVLAVSLTGVAVLLAAGSTRRVLAVRLIGGFDLILGGATLVEYLAGWDLRIDTLLLHPYLTVADQPPGRFAANTALCLVAFGLGLLLWHPDSRRANKILCSGALAVLSVAVVALVGYMAGLPHARGWNNVPMALSTAVMLCILVVGTFAVGLANLSRWEYRIGEWVAVPAAAAAVVVAGLIWQSLVRTDAGVRTVSSTSASRAALVLALVTGGLLGLTSWLAQRANRRLREAVELAAELQEEIGIRMVAERATREKERLLFQVLDALPVGVLLVTPDQQPYYGNLAARTMLPRGLGQVADPGYGNAIYDEYVAGTDEFYPADRSPLLRALAGESTQVDDIEIRADGTSTFLEIWGRPLRNEHGEVAFGLDALADITGRRRAEQEIVDKAKLLDLSQDAILIRDADRLVTYWNHGAETMFDFAAADAIGRDLVDLLRLRLPRPLDEIEEVLRVDGYWQGEVEAHDRSGRAMEVLTQWVAQRGPDGRVSSVMAINTDITGLKRAERELRQRAAELERLNQELERSNEDLSQFAYAASHDLAEPLRAISGPVSLLARRYRGQLDDEADVFIDFAVEGCERMQTLITDLLAFSRVGRLHSGWEELKLNDLLLKVRADLRPMIEERGAELDVADLPTVTGTRSELEQVFRNLVSNAIKFTPPERKPAIDVRAERIGDHWRFTITDNGIGVEPRYRERIFGMFKRLHTRDEYPGTGIGLALAKRIVERHEGEIGVDDGPDGVGSTFWFTLPSDKEAHHDDT